MAKRRTRAQKEKAKHNLTVSWLPTKAVPIEAKKDISEANVKRQLHKGSKTPTKLGSNIYNSVNSEQYAVLASTKNDIRKSLILAGLILASEVVLYLIWLK